MLDSEMTHKLVVEKTNLKCSIPGCEFYGNPQWRGFCSHCWREYQHQHQFNNIDSLKQTSSSSGTKMGYFDRVVEECSSEQVSVPPSKSWLGFDRFLEKKNQQANKKTSTFRSILKKSSSSDYTQLSTTSPISSNSTFDFSQNITNNNNNVQKSKLKRQLSFNSVDENEKFLAFCRKSSGQIGQILSKEGKKLTDKILSSNFSEIDGESWQTIDEMSEIIQDAYQHVQNSLKRLNASSSILEQSMDQLEHYLCFVCYSVLFCPTMDEEVADVSLQERIRSLHWVTAYGFLDSGIDLHNIEAREAFDNAVTDIVEMNSKRTPEMKLNCILKCSNMLLDALKMSRDGRPASADEFLPALIFVILKCNPPMLQSNIKFIVRFALPLKLMSGEIGYYFTNLCCALNFVQNLNSESLKMPKEEFEAYTSGLMFPTLSTDSLPGGKCGEMIKDLEKSLQQADHMHAKLDQLEVDWKEADKSNDRRWQQHLSTLSSLSNIPPPSPIDKDVKFTYNAEQKSTIDVVGSEPNKLLIDWLDSSKNVNGEEMKPSHSTDVATASCILPQPLAPVQSQIVLQGQKPEKPTVDLLEF